MAPTPPRRARCHKQCWRVMEKASQPERRQVTPYYQSERPSCLRASYLAQLMPLVAYRSRTHRTASRREFLLVLRNLSVEPNQMPAASQIVVNSLPRNVLGYGRTPQRCCRFRETMMRQGKVSESESNLIRILVTNHLRCRLARIFAGTLSAVTTAGSEITFSAAWGCSMSEPRRHEAALVAESTEERRELAHPRPIERLDEQVAEHAAGMRNEDTVRAEASLLGA